MTMPFPAGYVSSAAVMIPRHIVDKVGGLDRRLSYHVDADYCKRIADAGYKSYYLPTAAIIHLDHKGGTMVSLRRRFRSLVEFHVGSYIYYRKHVQKSAWAPMHLRRRAWAACPVCALGRGTSRRGVGEHRTGFPRFRRPVVLIGNRTRRRARMPGRRTAALGSKPPDRRPACDVAPVAVRSHENRDRRAGIG